MENYHDVESVDSETLHTYFDSISSDFGLFDNFKQNGHFTGGLEETLPPSPQRGVQNRKTGLGSF